MQFVDYVDVKAKSCSSKANAAIRQNAHLRNDLTRLVCMANQWLIVQGVSQTMPNSSAPNKKRAAFMAFTKSNSVASLRRLKRCMANLVQTC